MKNIWLEILKHMLPFLGLILLFVMIFSISVEEQTESVISQKAQEPITVSTTQQITPAATKEECYNMEKTLWGKEETESTDRTEEINRIYDVFKTACPSYPHQTATWSPDKYYFLSWNYQKLGMKFFREKNYEKAAFYYDKALEEYNRTSTPKVSPAIAYYEGGQAHFELGDWDKAEEYMLMASENLLLRNEILAKIYAQEFKIKKALAYYYKCLAIVEKTLDNEYEGNHLKPMDESQLLYFQEKKFYYRQAIKELSEYLDTPTTIQF